MCTWPACSAAPSSSAAARPWPSAASSTGRAFLKWDRW
uniref:Uncharacterized protein n=1 Tax=Arundo donax TaxID=35708 RepID=A0A0A9D1A4_ARUDO